ncbi:MAG: hypothetical protein FVQ80_16920 [Planctomycetes bacterium]|nr:hypothetical protein [Planctomycetota bacterium]
MYPLLRPDFLGATEVIVHVLGEGPQSFKPTRRQKLDALLASSGAGLPKSLLNLLFVRAAETAITPKQGTVTKDAFKRLVSKQHVYELIEKNLPSEVGYTELRDGLLEPQRRTGGYKTYLEAEKNLKNLESVSDRFYGLLSRTKQLRHERKREEIIEEQELQKKAKQHEAFKLSQGIQEMLACKGKLEHADLKQMSQDIYDYFSKKQDIEDKRNELRKQEDPEKNISWLDSARQTYGQFLNKTANWPQFVSVGAALLFSIGAVISHFIRVSLAMVILLVLTFVCLVIAALFTFVIRKGVRPEAAKTELRSIKEEFEARFAQQLRGLTDFQTMKEELKQRSGRLQGIRESVRSLEQEVGKLRSNIAASFSKVERNVGEDRWKQEIDELQEEKADIESRLHRAEGRIETISVDESDYLSVDPGVEYSQSRESELTRELDEVKNAITEGNEESNEVRENLIEHIGRNKARSSNIEDTAAAIEEKNLEYHGTIQTNLARMIAGHIVNETLQEFRKQEEQEIETFINDQKIIGLIKKFTGQYDEVSLDGENVSVIGEKGVYNLRNMSTGVQEQILLAFRMGIARKLSGDIPLFLILDDAFQFTHWIRRDSLVEQTVNIVKEGWQVVYFAVDDDIRDRFQRIAGSELSGEQFKFIEL